MSDPRPTESTAQTTTNGHESNGRFPKGNPGGPGNPFARQVAALRKVIMNRVTEEDLLAITEALLAKAKEGSVGAAKLLLAYAIGKPASAPDPDRLDGQELKHFKDQVETVQAVHELAKEVELAVDPRPAGGGAMSTDYALLCAELVRNPEKYDNPLGLEAVMNALKESDTSEGARPMWVPPSANGLFGGLPPRIRELAQALFAADASEAPSANGELRPPEEIEVLSPELAAEWRG